MSQFLGKPRVFICLMHNIMPTLAASISREWAPVNNSAGGRERVKVWVWMNWWMRPGCWGICYILSPVCIKSQLFLIKGADFNCKCGVIIVWKCQNNSSDVSTALPFWLELTEPPWKLRLSQISGGVAPNVVINPLKPGRPLIIHADASWAFFRTFISVSRKKHV